MRGPRAPERLLLDGTPRRTVGPQLAASIVEAIKACRLMVLVFSKSTNESAHVARELSLADQNEIPVVPVRIENVLPAAAFEYFLATTQWLDAFPSPVQRHLDVITTIPVTIHLTSTMAHAAA
jgi:hypothetical protein